MHRQETPDISVVMGVFNGGDRLRRTMDSVLLQEDCELEFIVVNDGSTDNTERILADYAAKDSRVRVVTQPNQGLTRALMKGCSIARGVFIARQDCGDYSLPGRLTRQLRYLRSSPQCSLVACGVKFVGPGGEVLATKASPGRRLHDGLAILDVKLIKGPPHHGGTMFSAEAYRVAGGYRPQFVVAQDIDLWLRLSEIGECSGLSDIGYVASIDAEGISSRRRKQQLQLAALAVECAKARRTGGSDEPVLGSWHAKSTSPGPSGPLTRIELARHLYFVGCNLRQSDPIAAKRYFRQAVASHPLHLRAVWRSILG